MARNYDRSTRDKPDHTGNGEGIPDSEPHTPPARAAGVEPIRWLHLSDLHLGCRGEALWTQVQEEFERSIREHAAEIGMPDLILFTGDRTNRGSETEFRQVDAFLDALLGWLADATGANGQPLIVPVPGNHDLVRPEGRELRNLRFLEHYGRGSADPDIAQFQQDLWTDRDAGDITPLFSNYQAWLERRILPQFNDPELQLHRSHFPGDLSLRIHPEGKFPLLLVGLNSSWMQYQEGDLQGRLELPLEQFHAALGDHGLTRFRDLDQALYTPDRFSLCLHGHMHRARSESVSISGGTYRHWFQSPSLFGLEHYGSANENRVMGYAWGELSHDGQIRVWPLRRTLSSGEMVFVSDLAFRAFPSVIRQAATDKTPKAVAAIPTADTRPWLEETLAQTGHIDIRGIGSGAGRVRTASRYPIERLYTQLSCRGPGLVAKQDRGLATGEQEQGLDALLPRHRLLLIEGQPGAGKTTFLRFTAALLARDRLALPAPDGGPWRERYLGLEATRIAPVPVFLRLALLERLLTEPDPRRPDNRQRLLELMLPEARAAEHKAWQRMFEAGEVLLLLDGMDEITDETRLDRVLLILTDLVRCWKETRIVVTSRPIDIRPLVEMGFAHMTIEPFDRSRVATFIDRWVGALYDTAPGQGAHAEAGDYRERLLAAITERPQLRRLAANPVMLTCLCVVHWNEGGLPDARARLYRAVLHWLRLARSQARAGAGFSDSFAERAFPALALAMMEGSEQEGDGKRVLFDVEEAAEALLPIAERDFPELTTPERLMLLRRWLHFECTGSGIIEELGRNRLRFWHLTFQEYLAAQQLAWFGDGDGADDWWPRIQLHLGDPQWRENVELLPGCLLDEGGQRRVDRLLERVLGLLNSGADLPNKARVAGIMGRLLDPMGAYGYRPNPTIQQQYADLLRDAMAVFDPEGAARVPVEDRIAAAEALGQGGDPRLAWGMGNLIEVPGLDGWSLGRYPVTVEEFLAFVDNDGYQDFRWWDAVGWNVRSEKGWETPDGWEEQLRTPNRPVVSISWFEANAYCAWLSAQWDREVCLPSEAQWQRTVQGDDGRKYPWGPEDPDPERANFQGNRGHPSPVGVYPSGNGRFGHCDLGGNVWEWCLQLWSEDDLPKNWRGQLGGVRVLRGGGWYGRAGPLQAARRYRDPARYRNDAVGFRIAVAPANLGS